MKYQRVLLKLSGEAFAGTQGFGFDSDVLKHIAQEIKEAMKSGVEIAVVVGGGNIWRGKQAENMGMERSIADYMGMLATIMNALALQDALESVGVDSRVQTALDVPEVAEPYIRRRAIRHLEKGRVVIFGGGTGLPYFSTDTTAALRAAEINADAILMAKNGVDGIYDADPKIKADAVMYQKISYMEVLQKSLQVMDSTAATMCMENNIDLVVFNMSIDKNIVRVIHGEEIGTVVKKEF